jgi:hypothetical protein
MQSLILGCEGADASRTPECLPAIVWTVPIDGHPENTTGSSLGDIEALEGGTLAASVTRRLIGKLIRRHVAERVERHIRTLDRQVRGALAEPQQEKEVSS